MSISPKYDGKLSIATAKARWATKWANKETTWSALLEKLKDTHRTHETYKEYITGKKSYQDQIKDIGGFVGGYLNVGRRKSGSVNYRQLVTLDIDAGKGGEWEIFEMLYECAGCMYTTHKHSAETPRLRLVIPLDREVFADEYVPIARRIAGDLGINGFDVTTYQPERLMYWPSTAKDGEYLFQWQDGPWLSADDVLGRYRDWRDSSTWPTGDSEHEAVRRGIKKQGDPLEKKGIVGAFCKTYGIEEVIEKYLGDVYEACDVDGRYTFKGGSTAAGLVLYENKFAFSHHGTDLCSGMLCNAFDLVRVHLYGAEDEDCKPETPGVKRPSFIKMAELAGADRGVRRMLGAERQAQIEEDFAGIVQEMGVEVIDVDDGKWMEDLEIDSGNRYKSTIDNVVLILDNDVRLKRLFRYDEFLARFMIVGTPPWRGGARGGGPFTDADAACLRHYLEKAYKISGRLVIADGLEAHLKSRAVHPVREYLSGLEWDGQARLDTLLVDYLGAEDTEYIRAVTRKTFAAGVARIFRPGCKFDNMLVLVGEQGCGKSTLVSRMGRRWFSDTFTGVHGKEAYEQIQGVWIMEMAELAGLRRADQETIKHFIGKTEDIYRPAYGHYTAICPRQCIFIGTTNEVGFLRDHTGNRRYWPVECDPEAAAFSVWDELMENEVGQLWAEAKHYYEKGELLHLSVEMEKQAKVIQKAHKEVDERTAEVINFLNIHIPENWDDLEFTEKRYYLNNTEAQVGKNVRNTICILELWKECFDGKTKDLTRIQSIDLGNIMRNLEGWEQIKQSKRFKHYGKQRYFKRTGTD